MRLAGNTIGVRIFRAFIGLVEAPAKNGCERPVKLLCEARIQVKRGSGRRPET